MLFCVLYRQLGLLYVLLLLDLLPSQAPVLEGPFPVCVQ